MSKKNRKRRRHNDPQSQRARRQLEKGDAKAALKDAKVCFRADPSDDNRRLLEEAFVARVEQLHRLRQISDAKAVLAELLKLDPKTQVAGKIPRLRVVLGDTSPDASALLESDRSLMVEMADQAVLDPRAVAPDHGDLKSQVLAVREALAAVERGEDEAAAERLTIISRNSPLADWRLLVRGLSAFYRQDGERTRNNWGRLDAARPASRIARTLLTAAGMAESQPAADLSGSLRKLERHTLSDPAIDLVKHLSSAWKQKNWRRFFQRYRQFKQRFEKSHEALLRQIVDLVWKRAVRDANNDLLDAMSKVGPAPEMDPHWRRAEALLSENPKSDADGEYVETEWIAYANDVNELPCLREEERPIAVGLIYQRLARGLVQYAKRLESTSLFAFYDPEEEAELLAAAASHFRRSIEACPRLQASYLELADLHEANDEAGKAARVMEKLAQQDPESFEAAIWLAVYFLAQDEPGKSERHVERARRLRPRDPRCTNLAWNQKITMVRGLTIKRQFQAARKELCEASEVAPPDMEPYTLDLLRAGIEFKAKNLEAAEGHVGTALAKVEEPLPIWMQMSSTAARMRVAREFKKEFDERFKADIEKRPTSASAGRMARFLLRIKVAKANYTGRATQEKLLIQYLNRALDIAWDERDLRHVCRFLAELPRQRRLQTEFIDKGMEAFPHVPHFHYWAGVQEMQSGPFFCDIPEAIGLFEKAVQLHNEGNVKLSEAEIEHARYSLSMAKDYHERQAFSGPSFGFDDEDDDFDNDDEDFDFGFTGDDDAGNDGGMFARLIASMPPEIRAELERIAAMGEEGSAASLRRLIAGMALGDPDDQAGDASKPGTKKEQASERKASR